MDLELAPDQELLQETTRRFLQASVPLTAVRDLADDPAGFDRGWWKRGAELGWTSLLVDEAHGGGSVSGEGLRDLALVAEEMGAMVSPGPLIPTNVVAQTLSCDITDDGSGDVLAELLSGESVATWCVAEPGRPVGPDGIALRAQRDGDGYVLDGVKRPVEAGSEADWLLVTA
jgi:alkylation response protein AidB-like acyl-CoA dehydrogenase